MSDRGNGSVIPFPSTADVPASGVTEAAEIIHQPGGDRVPTSRELVAAVGGFPADYELPVWA